MPTLEQLEIIHQCNESRDVFDKILHKILTGSQTDKDRSDKLGPIAKLIRDHLDTHVDFRTT